MDEQQQDINHLFDYNEIDSDQLLEFVSLARFYAASPAGLLKVLNREGLSSFTLQHLPFTLLPTPFMKSKFELALELQPHINLLWHKCAKDTDFLHTCLDNVAKSDTYISKLLDILDRTAHLNVKRIRLNMVRSDYMLHRDIGSSSTDFNLKQVELNTIAAGLINIGPRVQQVHHFTMKYYQQLKNIFAKPHKFQETLQPYFDPSNYSMPPNSADEKSVLAIYTAYENYCSLFQPQRNRTIVLFIVVQDDKEYNLFDQRPVEISLFTKYGIRVRRKTLSQLNKTMKLGLNDTLLLEDDEVAIGYFRSGYNPSFYPTSDEWHTRLIMEQSRAIICPDIGMHLMTFKSIQVKLSQPGIIEKYIKDSAVAEKISSVFAEQIALDGSDRAEAAISRAKMDQTAYVLKPNKEGGGNNLFNDDAINFLNEITDNETLASYVLMQRLHPPSFPVCLVNPDKKPEIAQGNNELGVMGHLIEVDGRVELNIEAGHVQKVKNVKDNESGISCGFGYVDSPLLY